MIRKKSLESESCRENPRRDPVTLEHPPDRQTADRTHRTCVPASPERSFLLKLRTPESMQSQGMLIQAINVGIVDLVMDAGSDGGRDQLGDGALIQDLAMVRHSDPCGFVAGARLEIIRQVGTSEHRETGNRAFQISVDEIKLLDVRSIADMLNPRTIGKIHGCPHIVVGLMNPVYHADDFVPGGGRQCDLVLSIGMFEDAVIENRMLNQFLGPSNGTCVSVNLKVG